MELKQVAMDDVRPETEYLIVSGYGSWVVAEFWTDMPEGEQWFNGDVFCDAVKAFELPDMKDVE